MTFAGLNYLAIIVAAVAGFATGMIWYNLLGKQWAAALGKAPGDMKPAPRPFITAALALLVMAWMLAGLIGHLGEVTLRSGAVSGAFVWFGFVLTTVAVNHAFQGAKTALTAINAGHWLAVLVIMGGVIGAFGV